MFSDENQNNQLVDDTPKILFCNVNSITMFGQDFSLNSAITNLVNGHQTALELSRFRLEDGSDGDNPKRKRKMERGALSLKNIILSEKKT